MVVLRCRPNTKLLSVGFFQPIYVFVLQTTRLQQSVPYVSGCSSQAYRTRPLLYSLLHPGTKPSQQKPGQSVEEVAHHDTAHYCSVVEGKTLGPKLENK